MKSKIIDLLKSLKGKLLKSIIHKPFKFTLTSYGIVLVGALGMKIVPSKYFGVVERFRLFAATDFNAALGIPLFCMNTDKNQFNERGKQSWRRIILS